jgi:hypothetical protein
LRLPKIEPIFMYFTKLSLAHICAAARR